MLLSNLRDKDAFFQVLQTSKKSQTATMTLAPGKSSGPKTSKHRKSEQVLLVLEGELLAEIGKEKMTLRKGDVAIVPKKTPHRFTNKAASPAKTFNVYAPPAYDAD